MATKKEEIPVIEEINPLDDRVIINIAPPTEEDEDKGEYVSVNEYNAYIKYGVDVEVPRFVLAVLQNRKRHIKEMKERAQKAKEK